MHRFIPAPVDAARPICTADWRASWLRPVFAVDRRLVTAFHFISCSCHLRRRRVQQRDVRARRDGRQRWARTGSARSTTTAARGDVHNCTLDTDIARRHCLATTMAYFCLSTCRNNWVITGRPRWESPRRFRLVSGECAEPRASLLMRSERAASGSDLTSEGE